MANSVTQIKNELASLITEGRSLLIAHALATGALNDDEAKQHDAEKLPIFRIEYDSWYTKAIYAVKHVCPERASDFVSQYKNEKRKDITPSTYTIYDSLIGVSNNFRKIYPKNAQPKLLHQLSILMACEEILDSSLYRMRETIQAELFDNEIDAAKELHKNGYFRAAGALAGVVLERHLGQVCTTHNVAPSKKNPTINDFNQSLKENGIIDIPTWRSIQFLGDIRNECDHPKTTEPTKERTKDLLDGVSKIIKTVY